MGMLATVTNMLVALPCTLLLLTSFLPFFITKGLVASFRNFHLLDGRNPSEKSNPGTSDRHLAHVRPLLPLVVRRCLSASSQSSAEPEAVPSKGGLTRSIQRDQLQRW